MLSVRLWLWWCVSVGDGVGRWGGDGGGGGSGGALVVVVVIWW